MIELLAYLQRALFLSFSLVERSAEYENFECVRVSQQNHMNGIFPNYIVDTMIVYEVALGLFALQIHDLLVAQN